MAKEYIEREAAKQAVVKAVGVGHSPFNAIVMLPAADVRPVVMCKVCMHWEYDAIFADGWCRGRQQGNPNWYCADGEKREES